jgi:Domain of unknown function (DUF3597)
MDRSPQGSASSAAGHCQPTYAAVLDDAVRLRGQKLNWRESIVDLMKVLNVNSTYGARKQLAARWRYGGDMEDSGSMNLWLHRRIIKLLEGNSANLDGDVPVIKLPLNMLMPNPAVECIINAANQ